MSKRGIKDGQTLSATHRRRIAEGMRESHARRVKLQADFALQVLAVLKPVNEEPAK